MTNLMWVVTASVVGDQPFLGRPDQLTGGVIPPKENKAPKKGWSPPTGDSHHPEREVTDFVTSTKMPTFDFTPPGCLFNILA